MSERRPHADSEPDSSAGELDHRLRRIAALLNAGVDVRSAIATEIIRSLRIGALSPEQAQLLFDRLAESDPESAEVAKAREAFEASDKEETVQQLQAYLHRVTVEDVPIAKRRMWKRERA
ncbi:MAG: hypothetical protein ACR2NA_01345 [Solirubrobacterales bacterium]